MFVLVIHQGNRFPGKFVSVVTELVRGNRIRDETADGNVINGLLVGFVLCFAIGLIRPRSATMMSILLMII